MNGLVMLNALWRLMVVLSCLLALCSCRKKAETVVILEGERYAVVGKLVFSAAAFGSGEVAQPKLPDPGNVIIFRVDQEFAGTAGRGGTAYRVNKEAKLELTGRIDTRKSNHDLARQFGVVVEGSK